MDQSKKKSNIVRIFFSNWSGFPILIPPLSEDTVFKNIMFELNIPLSLIASCQLLGGHFLSAIFLREWL